MKTCIITGASDGIGKATAFDLAKSGEYDNLVLISRSLDKLNNTYFAIKEFVSVDIRPFDLCNLDEIPNLINDIFNKYKSIDCLINVAGYTDPKPLLQTTIDNLYETYTVNVFAPIILMRECARFMKQNNSFSKIISVASTAGISPRPGWLSYASSKAALISVSQTLSQELAEYKIKVYTVSPGRCATSLRRKLAPNEDQSKIMKPKDVAHIISNLVSKDEMFLDGQNIIIRKKFN